MFNACSLCIPHLKQLFLLWIFGNFSPFFFLFSCLFFKEYDEKKKKKGEKLPKILRRSRIFGNFPNDFQRNKFPKILLCLSFFFFSSLFSEEYDEKKKKEEEEEEAKKNKNFRKFISWKDVFFLLFSSYSFRKFPKILLLLPFLLFFFSSSSFLVYFLKNMMKKEEEEEGKKKNFRKFISFSWFPKFFYLYFGRKWWKKKKRENLI